MESEINFVTSLVVQYVAVIVEYELILFPLLWDFTSFDTANFFNELVKVPGTIFVELLKKKGKSVPL